MELFSLFVTLTLETAGFMRGINQQRRTISDFTGNVQKKVSAASVAIGNLAAQGIQKVASTAVSVTKQALNVVKEYEQNLGGSEAVWGEWAESIQATSTKAFKNMGLSASDYLATANQMGSLFKGAGFTTGEALVKTTEAMQRAADVASIMGIDADWAMESIAGLAKGNFTMMDNLGVAINDTTLANYALEKGIKKSTSAMTTQEKIGLALELFMERTSEYAGNYVKENSTLAGSYEVLSAAYENMLIGQEGATDDFVDALEMAAKTTIKNLGQIIPRLGTSMLQAIQKALPKVKTAFVDFWNNKLPTIATNGANSVIGIINDLFGTNIPEITEIKLPTWSDIETTVTEWWESIKGSFSSVISFDGMAEALPAAFEHFKSFAGDIGVALNAISAWVTENKDLVLGFLGSLLIALAATNAPLAAGIVLLALLAANWETVKSTILAAWDAVQTFFSATIPAAWESMVKTIGNWWNQYVVDPINNAINTIKSFFGLIGQTGNGDLLDIANEPTLWSPEKGYYANPDYVPGSRVGLDYVPYDGYLSQLHTGEAVLTRTEAERWRNGDNSGNVEIDYSRLASAVALAVSGISVNMDGQAVGRLVSPTVSREIAHEAKARRYSR